MYTTAVGAVTVLVSLLSNEAAAVQFYSCGILANMLVWEARKIINDQSDYQKEKNINNLYCTENKQRNKVQIMANLINEIEMNTRENDEPTDNLEVVNSEEEVSLPFVTLRTQITACDGLRPLTGLLTSPSGKKRGNCSS